MPGTYRPKSADTPTDDAKVQKYSDNGRLPDTNATFPAYFLDLVKVYCMWNMA